MSLYNAHKFENQLTRFRLTGVALHAQALKYEPEARFTNFKDSIAYTYNNKNCRCAETLIQLLSSPRENGMVRENFQAGIIQDAHRRGLD